MCTPEKDKSKCPQANSLYRAGQYIASLEQNNETPNHPLLSCIDAPGIFLFGCQPSRFTFPDHYPVCRPERETARASYDHPKKRNLPNWYGKESSETQIQCQHKHLVERHWRCCHSLLSHSGNPCRVPAKASCLASSSVLIVFADSSRYIETC